MNNASSSSSHPQHNDTNRRQQQPATPLHSLHASTAADEEEEDHVPTNEYDRDDPALRKKRIRRDQKIQFFDHLIRNLDMVIYCQISILYYMDISLLGLLIRAVFHYILLTPKPPLPPAFQPFPPSPPPSFPLISLTNLIPFLIHAFTRSPSASEVARGYLHGSILIDFVGQAPVSKLRLVVLDFLVFGLQVVMMTLVLERRQLGPPVGTSTEGSDLLTSSRHRMRNQDHDAEERGVLLPSSPLSPLSPTAELDDRHPSFPGGRREGTAQDRDSPNDDHFSSGSHTAVNQQHALDSFRSGQYVVANLHLTSMIRDEWVRHTRRATSSGSAASGTETRTGIGRLGPTGPTASRRGVHRVRGRLGRRRDGE